MFNLSYRKPLPPPLAPAVTAVAAAGGALPYELLRPNVFKPELKEELKLELLVFGPLFAKATQM